VKSIISTKVYTLPYSLCNSHWHQVSIYDVMYDEIKSIFLKSFLSSYGTYLIYIVKQVHVLLTCISEINV